MFWPQPKKVVERKKYPFSKIDISLLGNFGCFVGIKCTFGQKTTKFGSKLAILVILVQALPANLVHCWWVGWWLWRTGCISQDTYLLYHIVLLIIK